MAGASDFAGASGFPVFSAAAFATGGCSLSATGVAASPAALSCGSILFCSSAIVLLTEPHRCADFDHRLFSARRSLLISRRENILHQPRIRLIFRAAFLNRSELC